MLAVVVASRFAAIRFRQGSSLLLPFSLARRRVSKLLGGSFEAVGFEGNQSQAMGRVILTRTSEKVVQKIPILDSFLVGSILCMFSIVFLEKKHLSERMPFDSEIILPNASSFFVRFSVVFGLSREFETY